MNAAAVVTIVPALHFAALLVEGSAFSTCDVLRVSIYSHFFRF